MLAPTGGGSNRFDGPYAGSLWDGGKHH